MDKATINNEIVKLRPLVKKTKVHVIHHLTRTMKQLRDKKGSEKLVEKSRKRADRLLEELQVIKKFKIDDVSKAAVKTSKAQIQGEDSIEGRALKRLTTHKLLEERTKQIKDLIVASGSIQDTLDQKSKDSDLSDHNEITDIKPDVLPNESTKDPINERNAAKNLSCKTTFVSSLSTSAAPSGQIHPNRKRSKVKQSTGNIKHPPEKERSSKKKITACKVDLDESELENSHISAGKEIYGINCQIEHLPEDKKGKMSVKAKRKQSKELNHEKLHPSWEASKRRKEQQSKILPFEGTKITFDLDD